MEQPPESTPPVDRHVTGPLERAAAGQLLDQGAALLESGDYPEAFATYQRVVGFDDPEVTAAALLGMAQARYRMDDEDGAVRTWEAVLELPETSSTYHAWRNVAAARVRDGDLQGAIAAYREAERRAPQADKAEIANRLGWLAKETGNVRASRRYFARGRGGFVPYATYAILGVTIAVSLAAMLSSDGSAIYDALQLDKRAVAAGELWRLWTVTLLHDPNNFLHLLFNMYALYLAGPIVERLYGSTMLVIFYLVCALGGSLGSFGFGGDVPSIGASGAIFGLFGILLIATRTHHPALDRGSRNFVAQLGTLLIVNVIFGIIASGYIDNFAHAGGFVTGALLGIAFVPGKVATMRSMWQAGSSGQLAAGFIGSPFGRIAALLVLVGVMAIAAVVGLGRWG
ncbi:MAG TPA: rhomboid family intramembrane serine protease [Verrucomicrobiae bacterium]|jgi:membrane associated rhomboid family serine protease|nr:rhomboid family intramembrane serine protease [Verrucomicrobiae bacterium]